jgi:Bacterial regulatory proteins, tetR family.
MIDTSSSKGKIVAAALRLAERQGWRDTGLDEIAAEAGISLAELRRDFQSKGQILAAFTRMVDDAVLAGLKPADANASPRDRLFDVIMSRFDAMMPYKGGLKRIGGRPSLRTARSLRATHARAQVAILDADRRRHHRGRGAGHGSGEGADSALYARVRHLAGG